MDSGTKVLRIQKQRMPLSGATNSMPSLVPICRRNIMPVACCSGVTASSVSMTWKPAVSLTVGRRGCGPVWARAGPAPVAHSRAASARVVPRGRGAGRGRSWAWRFTGVACLMQVMGNGRVGR